MEEQPHVDSNKMPAERLSKTVLQGLLTLLKLAPSPCVGATKQCDPLEQFIELLRVYYQLQTGTAPSYFVPVLMEALEEYQKKNKDPLSGMESLRRLASLGNTSPMRTTAQHQQQMIFQQQQQVSVIETGYAILSSSQCILRCGENATEMMNIPLRLSRRRSQHLRWFPPHRGTRPLLFVFRPFLVHKTPFTSNFIHCTMVAPPAHPSTRW